MDRHGARHGEPALSGFARENGCLLACRELPFGRADLSSGQSAARGPARAPSHQAAPARPLGHDAGVELPLRAPQSADPGKRSRHDLHHRPRSRRARSGGAYLSRRHLHRDLSEHRAQPERTAAPVPAVLVALWGSEPRRARGAGVDPRTAPGSIREGGALGYSLAHAFGAAFDNPDLIVACIVGDGEAETGALAASWHSNKFLDPARDGAVLPILHLNGYKIANPTVLARISREELTDLLRGYGYEPLFVEGNEPAAMHQALAGTLDRVLVEIRTIQTNARADGNPRRPRWPMVVFRTPKGWTGPKFVDGKPVEGTWRAHQVPISDF